MSTAARGIVVLGFPRSGTTLLRRILDAHPNIACPGETCLLTACSRFLHAETVADGLEFGVLNGLAFAGFNPEETLTELREFAFGFFRRHAAAQGKPRWAEKTAVDVFYLDEIERLCGDAVQYVCVVRHGLDVACSVQEFSERGYGYLSELHEYVKRFPRPLEAFAHAWSERNAALRKFHDAQSENSILLRYEDLVADPSTETQLLFKHLGEDWNDDLLTQATGKSQAALGLGDWKNYERATIETASVARWKHLPRSLISTLGEICNPTLEMFGYDPVPIGRSTNQTAARRRYELSLHVGAKPGPDLKQKD